MAYRFALRRISYCCLASVARFVSAGVGGKGRGFVPSLTINLLRTGMQIKGPYLSAFTKQRLS